MSSPQNELHRRHRHSKVLTGCVNCKRRKVKCDEGQPGCRRCQKAGILCVGYRTVQARIFEPSSGFQPSFNEDFTRRSGSPGLNFPPAGQKADDEEGLENPAIILTKAPDLRLIWQIALLDSFLVIWLPDPLFREDMLGHKSQSMIPMSAWPLVAWKLSKKHPENFVAHAILCLILCTLGVRTGNPSLIREASRHYARVLHHFQSQVALLADSGYSAKRNDLVASLAAAGFCCSQVEYILQSWSNGDQHLHGMASLLKACGPLSLQYQDTRQIFYDHCLLWVSCSVVHRQSSIYSEWPWAETNWTELVSSCELVRELLGIAALIPSLLEEYDSNSSNQNSRSVHMLDLLQRFIEVFKDLEALETSCGSILETTPKTPLSHHSLLSVMVAGYTSAFQIHVLLTLLKTVQSISTDSLPSHAPNEDQLLATCEHHVTKLCISIDRLANEQYGMLTASPLLFFIDAASIAYVVLAEQCSRDYSEVNIQLNQISSQLAKRGYPPFRVLG